MQQLWLYFVYLAMAAAQWLRQQKTLQENANRNLSAAYANDGSDGYVNLQWDAPTKEDKDNSYVVKAKNENGSVECRSNEKEVNVTSGVKEYLVYTDNKPDTNIYDLTHDRYDRSVDDAELKKLGIQLVKAEDFNGTCSVDNKSQGECYVHVAALGGLFFSFSYIFSVMLWYI